MVPRERASEREGARARARERDSRGCRRVEVPETLAGAGGVGRRGGSCRVGGAGDNVWALQQPDVLATLLASLSALELVRLRRTCLALQAAVDPIILSRLIALRPCDTDPYGRAQRLYRLLGTGGSCRFCGRALVATPCTKKYRCKLERCSNKYPYKRIDRRCPYVKCDSWFEDRHGYWLGDLF